MLRKWSHFGEQMQRVAGHVFRRYTACQIAQGHRFEHEL